MKIPFRSKTKTSINGFDQYERPPKPPPTPQQPARQQAPQLDEAEQRRQANASIESVRRVRDLIREKYRLDIYVWSNRHTLQINRPLIMRDGLRADRILQDVRGVVGEWERNILDAEEWAVVRQIQDGLAQNRDPLWAVRPPWYRQF